MIAEIEIRKVANGFVTSPSVDYSRGTHVASEDLYVFRTPKELSIFIEEWAERVERLAKEKGLAVDPSTADARA